MICTLLVQCWNSFNIEVMQLTHSFVDRMNTKIAASVHECSHALLHMHKTGKTF